MYASLHKLKDIPARWQLTFQCTEEYYVFLQVKSNAQDFGNLPIQSAEVYNVLCIRSKVETMPSAVASCHFNGGATHRQLSLNGGAALRQSAISNAGAMEVSSAGEPYRNNKASTSDRTQSRKQKELILKPKFHSYWISRSIWRIKKNYVRPT